MSSAHSIPNRASGPGTGNASRARGAIAALILVTSLIAGCASAVSAPSGTSGASGSRDASPAGSPIGALASRTLPSGAQGTVDDGAWLIARRLAAASYTRDTTAALVAGLARSGIGTFADASSTSPEVTITGSASPFRLLDFQVHALAVGAWTGSAFSGAELDAVLPTPADPTPMPTTSEVLAGYVAAADSPGAALSRALMAGQNLLSPTTLQFPAVVMVLFASDIATDGGTLPAPAASPVAGAAGARLPLAAIAMAGPGRAVAPIPAAATGGVCTETANWINGMISSLFAALKLATPDNLPGKIVVSIWNWLVSAGEAFVQGLIDSVTGAVLGTVRSIAGTIAAVATQIASLIPYGLRVVAVGPTGGGTFMLGPDPLDGSFNVSVSAGDLPDWPAVLTDCAKVAKVPLADFHNTKDVPLIWGPLRAAANPLISPNVPKTDDVTDANGQATWGFTTSTDPGDPSGEQQNQVDQMPVTIHRPEVESARAQLTAALLGVVPGLLQPFVAAIFAPYISGVQARLNALLDARGTATAILVYHSGASPKPSVSASPAPSGACSPNPVGPGTYKGTFTATSSEVIDQGSFGKTVATSDGSGAVTVVVAPDGSLGGTWASKSHFVFDETAIVDGVVGLHDHRDSVSSYAGGPVSGTACNLELGPGTYSVQSCVDSLKGDCTGDPAPPNRTPVPGGFGPPSSATPGHVIWRWHYSGDTGAVVSADLTIDVSGQTP
jgi:hypothetical protein